MIMIIGCGYIGQRLALHYQRQDIPVAGITRTNARVTELAEDGIRALQHDLDHPSPTAWHTAGEPLFYLVPPPPRGITDTRMQHFLDSLDRNHPPRKIVLVSTSGVYGNCAGEWVDETRPAHPETDRGRRRLDAEIRLKKWCREAGCDWVILRVAGIYGPGKLPLARLKRQLPMVSEAEAPWTNRIHADDLVQVLTGAMKKGHPGEIFNASDGNPGNMRDYFNRVADLFGLSRPPLISLADADDKLSAGLISYLRESRRMNNQKMLRTLDIRLHYPTLESGLSACLAGNNRTPDSK